MMKSFAAPTEHYTCLGKPPKKTGKKLHNSCELSPKMENPPPPISQQFQPLSELEN